MNPHPREMNNIKLIWEEFGVLECHFNENVANITYFCILVKAAAAFLHSQLGTYGANIYIRNNGVYFEWAKLCLYLSVRVIFHWQITCRKVLNSTRIFSLYECMLACVLNMYWIYTVKSEQIFFSKNKIKVSEGDIKLTHIKLFHFISKSWIDCGRARIHLLT